MKTQITLTIKVIITLSLAVVGIIYLLKTPPSSQYSRQGQYQNNSINRSYESASHSDNDADNGASLTGSKNRYDEARVGKITD